jgi:hypothetical protein
MYRRDGGLDLLCLMRATCTKVRLIWADGGYAGKPVHAVRRRLGLTPQIVKRHRRPGGLRRPAPHMGGRAHVVRREALCCIPGLAGRDLEGYLWAEWLTWIRKVKGTVACQEIR